MSAYRSVPLRKLQQQRGDVPEEFAWDIHDRSEVDATLARAAKAANVAGATCVVHAAEVDPVSAILDVPTQEEAGLVVVGNKGMERRLLSSVPELGRAPRPHCGSHRPRRPDARASPSRHRPRCMVATT